MKASQTKRTATTLLSFILLVYSSAFAGQSAKWTKEKASGWYRTQPFLLGSNYNPATAVNELEMWQAETFDPTRIDLELGWAEDLGMNTMRVFLHDLLWQQDREGFKRRIDQFLSICAKHNIKPMLVLFDSCWDPYPAVGRQPQPRPGIHNSGWVQSPGAIALSDPTQYPRLEAYVKGVVGAFKDDRRILAWDVWNEPDNTNDRSYNISEPYNKVQLVLALLPHVFEWARSAGPSQPLTSGVWRGDYSSDAKLSVMQRLQLDSSDVISFHNYEAPEEFEKRVQWLQRYQRPILCTEFMARSNKSTFRGVLPIAQRYKVAVINWGLVAGKTQTFLPWDSWQHPYVSREPSIWEHEVLRTDGTPIFAEEAEFIKSIMGRSRQATLVHTSGGRQRAVEVITRD